MVVTKHFILHYWKIALLVASLLVVFVLLAGVHQAGTAQSQSPQISLNSPVTFPGDI